MASFCRQCAEELDFDADFTGLFTETGTEVDAGYYFPVLCETCGPRCRIVDDRGSCGSPYCSGHMAKPGPHGTKNEETYG